ncbi:MAG TPA: DUF2752 domain-containing protein [Pyrinomonadaceae bacterium]|nr:DUF2752 domain-containing protein [Pyrinomonadaceae bacterium]
MQDVVNGPMDISGSSRLERILAAAGAGAMLTGAAAVSYFDPTKAGFFPVCPLYSLTGFACPGCGLTRGFHALFHGDVLTALDYNAMLPFFAALIGFGFVSLVYFAANGRRLPMNLLHPTALYVFLVLLLIFGVTRNLPWYPFNVLFP